MNRRLEELEAARPKLVAFLRVASDVDEDSTALDALRETDPRASMLERAAFALSSVIAAIEKEKQRTEGGPRL